MITESQAETSSFSVDDVIERLGVQVLSTADEAEVATKTSTALAAFRAAPTIKAIGRDLARVAAFTSDNHEGARKRWLERLVMKTDADGRVTDMPLIVTVAFNGERRTVNGVVDIGVGAELDIEGMGRVSVQPLFTVGIGYIGANREGTLIPLRMFTGVLFAPKDGKGVFKFVPIELADPMLIARWNSIVEQGEKLGTVHKDWPKIEAIQTSIGKPGQCLSELVPSYLVEKQFERVIGYGKRARTVKVTETRIATRFLKTVILHNRSQIPPVEAIEANVVAIEAGAAPTEKFVFAVVERENSLVVTLRGRPGEAFVTDAATTIEEVGEQMNPFDVLDTSVERFEAGKAQEFVGRCISMPINDNNPLYRKAMELGLVIHGQPLAVIGPQLSTLAGEALKKARNLWDEALKATWNDLKRFDLPKIEDCLDGKKLEEVKRQLNQPEDVVANWITSHIQGEYTHRSPFFRTLRVWVFNAIAKKAGYSDPEVKTEAPAGPPKGSNGEANAAQPSEDKPADKPARKPRKGTQTATA